MPNSGTFGKAKHCIILYLAGGPPQHETFDPKPDAPREIRGEFKPIVTSVPGIHFSELLPRTAQLAHRMAVVRSMFTDVNSHATSGYWMLTGARHESQAESLPPSTSDWPSLAAVIGALKPTERSPFSSVVLPEVIHNNPNITWPGQDGGFMGHTWNPSVFKCDPAASGFEIDGLKLPAGVSALRVTERASLLRQLDDHFLATARSESIAALDRVQQRAFDLVQNSATRAAFELEREQPVTRDRYGRHKFGQSCLLARRLIESGARLVQVNWPREKGDADVGNPLWDTHQKMPTVCATCSARSSTPPTPRCSRTCTSVDCWTKRSSSRWASLAARPSTTAAAGATTGAIASPSRWLAAAFGAAGHRRE